MHWALQVNGDNHDALLELIGLLNDMTAKGTVQRALEGLGEAFLHGLVPLLSMPDEAAHSELSCHWSGIKLGSRLQCNMVSMRSRMGSVVHLQDNGQVREQGWPSKG